jgi:hypothetical protein
MGSEYTIQDNAAMQGSTSYFGKLIKKIVKNVRADIEDIRVSIIHRTIENRVVKVGIELGHLAVNPPEDQDIDNLM